MRDTLIINGRLSAEVLEQNLAAEIAAAQAKPFLAVVLVGHNDASEVYVRNKRNRCLKAGIACEIFRLDENVAESELLSLIDDLNANPVEIPMISVKIRPMAMMIHCT